MSLPSADQVWSKKEWIVGGVAALLAVRQLHSLSQSKHASLSHGVSTGTPPDPTLFPQFLPSASVPALWLYHRRWEVSPEPTCAVFLIHGYGEHCGRYEGVAARLNEIGANVYALDHQGHGQSDGDRAYVENFDHYVQDALAFVEYIQQGRLKEYGGSGGQQKKPLPCFLLGHSMGGLIATKMMRASYPPEDPSSVVGHWSHRLWPWTGCIMSAPALMANPKTATPTMLAIGGWLSRWLPKLQLTSLDVDRLSHVAAIKQQYDSDRLCWHGTIRARWAVEMGRAMKEVAQAHATIKWPVLILQGDEDTLVHPPGATKFYEEIASSDKQLKVWKGGYHELFMEGPVVQAEVIREVLGWITQRLK